jgi:hypothetical protein
MEVPFETKRVFEHLDKLVYEIGPRPGGSRAEAEAASYAEQELKGCGLKVRVQRFRLLRPRFLPVLLLSLPASLLLHPAPALALWLALLCLTLSGRAESRNVLAGSGEARLVLAAQLDSGPCGRRFPFPLLAAGLSAITLLLALRLFWDFPLWPFCPLWLIPVAASLRTEFSPGAGDASGLAVLLEVARLAGKKVLFVAVGSAELSRAGMRILSKELPKAPVVCVERVGGKSLTWAGHASLSGLSKELGIKPGTAGILCSRFLSLGFPSASLSSAGAGPHRDTPNDLPERLSPETLELASLTLLKLVGRFTETPSRVAKGAAGPPEEVFVQAGPSVTEPLLSEAKKGGDKAEKLVKAIARNKEPT